MKPAIPVAVLCFVAALATARTAAALEAPSRLLFQFDTN